MNLMTDFCRDICKFSKDEECEVLKLKKDIYCPAEHFSHWLSKRLHQEDLEYYRK